MEKKEKKTFQELIKKPYFIYRVPSGVNCTFVAGA
jgi:hypothetical protein